MSEGCDVPPDAPAAHSSTVAESHTDVERKAEDSVSSAPEKPLSKNQQRKMAARAKNLQKRHAKRKEERERKQAKRKRAAELGIVDEDAKRRHEISTANKRRRLEELGQGVGSVVIDCGFDSVMTDAEVRSFAKQCNFSYASNMRAERPVALHFTSMGGNLAEHLSKHSYSNWKVHTHERSYLEEFDPKRLVYLTTESDNVLQEWNPDDVYIIGGLVDHNRLKGVCYEKATAQGIRTAQLPIGDYLQMESRKVLTVNQVFDILLRFVDSGDWLTSLHSVIPPRKGAIPVGTKGGSVEVCGSDDVPANGSQTAAPSSDIVSSVDTVAASSDVPVEFAEPSHLTDSSCAADVANVAVAADAGNDATA